MQQKRKPKPGDSFFRVKRRIEPWSIPLAVIPKQRSGGLPTLKLIGGFGGIILFGTILLMLPFSSVNGGFTSLVTALFTSTSAVCVTGLVVVDTGTYWSIFGQVVICVLIMVGGFGFMTSASILLSLLGRRIGLQDRLMIGETLHIEQRSGDLIKMVKRIAVFSLTTEAVGAIILLPSFYRAMHSPIAIWQAFFQSVSAFNNAGFDVIGNYQSLTAFQSDVVMLLGTAMLIIIGGSGFVVIMDIWQQRRFRTLSLNSKMVVVTTVTLLGLGTLVLLVSEWANPQTLGTMPFFQKLMNAFFHAVTPRTAGFNSLDVARLTGYSLLITIVLMFIGGASGSTAGGIKVNTFGMLITTIISTMKGKQSVGAFGREFRIQQIYRALTVVIISILLVLVMFTLLTLSEDIESYRLLFETVSAFGTVGLSMGITSLLTVFGKIVIVLTMFIGRLGPLSLVLSSVQRQYPNIYRYPQESISIG